METLEIIIQSAKIVGGIIVICLLYQIKKTLNNIELKGGQE